VGKITLHRIPAYTARNCAQWCGVSLHCELIRKKGDPTLYYARQQTELHQPSKVSMNIFKTFICPPALQVLKLLMHFNPLKHTKLIKILFKISVSTLGETTVDAVNENDHCFF
jgi:hypothetical protein